MALQGRTVIPTIITMFKALLTYVNIIDSLDMQSYAMSQAGMGFLQAPSGRIRNSSPSAFGLGQGIPNPALGRLQKSPIPTYLPLMLAGKIFLSFPTLSGKDNYPCPMGQKLSAE